MKTNLQANQASRTHRGSVNVIRTIAAFVLVAVMTVGGINLRLITVEAAGVPAGYEPTITTSIGGTQNRELFTSRGADAPFYFNGRIYSRAEFFDTHHGNVFRVSLMTTAQARERFNIDNGVWEATLRQGQTSPPVRIDGGTSPSTPASTPQPAPTPNSTQPPSQAGQNNVIDNTGNSSNGQGHDVVSGGNNNNNGSQAVVTPNPAPSTSVTTSNHERQSTRNEITWPQSPCDPLWLAHDRTSLPFVYTRSSIALPNRVSIESEVQGWVARWIEEYWVMGGMSAFELEVVRLTNLERTNRGLNELEICFALSMASRVHAQAWLEDNTPNVRGHDAGVFGGSRRTAEAFGINNRNGANGAGGSTTPQSVVNVWMNSSGHRANILREGITHVGFGSFLSFDAPQLHHYQMFR